MKKICLSILAIAVTVGIVSAASNNQEITALRNSYIAMSGYYQKLSSCTPYKVKFSLQPLFQVKQEWEIIGKENNACKTRTRSYVQSEGKVDMGQYSCRFPENIYPVFGSKLSALYNAEINRLDKGGSIQEEAALTNYKTQIENKYCQF